MNKLVPHECDGILYSPKHESVIKIQLDLRNTMSMEMTDMQIYMTKQN